jgi:hypothetical protein
MQIIARLKQKLEDSKEKIEEIIDTQIKADVIIRERRLDLCLSCEHLFKPTDSCKKCGCFVRAKTWLKDAKCPLNKW